MTLLNYDEFFDNQKLDMLFEQLTHLNTNDNLFPVIKDIKASINSQLKAYQQLRFAVEQSSSITITDINGKITYVDDNFCKLTKFSKEELLNRSHKVLNSAFHDKQFFESLWNTILSGEVWNGDIRNKRKDGSILWLHTTIVPLMEEEGLPPCAFIAFRTDITEKVKLEEKVISGLNSDYQRVFRELMNLVFRIENRSGQDNYYCTMVEGKLTKKLGITQHSNIGNLPIEGKHIGEVDLPIVKSELEKVFKGQEVTIKHKFRDHYLYTMLSPIIKDGQVVEAIGSSVDITSLEEAEQQVRYLAYHDPLTELPNRTKFTVDIDELIQHSNRDQPFSIMLCDIDRLKYINDALGQYAGDQVLQTISNRLRSIIEPHGLLYRFGGDEFIAVIKEPQEIVAELSERVGRAINKPIPIVGKEFFITSSIGMSTFYKDGITTEELISHASIAVHYGKVNGRNSRFFYSPKMNRMYNDLLLLEGEIRRALSSNEFVLHYQPKIDVETGRVIGMEALIRWFHKERGFIPPSKFIPLAEETGLITQLGEWVIREACYQHVKWKKAGFDPMLIAVNVSAIELQRSDFAKKVHSIIEETGMDPEFLEIEITENSVMQNTEDCIETMNVLRTMGISLSIDDFGTGYSSFGYLRKFPINYLKIDQSFVKNALKESSSGEIIKAMIQLAHTFGLKVVAEGVEDSEILLFIKEQNCDLYQGYYFSTPLDPLDIERQFLSLTAS
ncbi:sensor domain-containing protein [Aquibacillus kalidii]|uniref:sensor domain-containing protein n=1 Tax=Aquibacillus kalidii TaxID=2762597 RepID=UPI0016455D72|nr:EAL domain-containing protein [Aquibacillus kalidii]